MTYFSHIAISERKETMRKKFAKMTRKEGGGDAKA
jgi:hypothetical protein